MLIVGQQAPDFEAINQDGVSVKLSDFRGHCVVLYCYPKDFTPGCTKEACDFQHALKDLQQLGTVVLGVNLQSPEKHRLFANKYNLHFSLLSDPEGEIVSLYSSWNRLRYFGIWFGAIDRSTFILDDQGKIRRIWRNVNLKTHTEEVLEFLRTLKLLQKNVSPETLFSPRL